MKRILCFSFLLLFCFLFSAPASAAQQTSSQQDVQEYYREQFQKSGAADLQDSLPQDTKKILDQLGVDEGNWSSISSITPQNYFQKIVSVFTGKLPTPLRVIASVIAVILLCALLNSVKLSFGEQPLGGVVGMVGTLCVCTLVVTPIVACISDAADMLKAASGFLLACVPVLVGIMAAAGQPVSAASYHMVMVAAGDTVSVFSSTVLVPMMNIFLAISVVSAISPGINLGGLCTVLNKSIKWVMGLCMTLFTSLITMHSIVASAADSTTSKTAKFIVSSFVPVVGNALGEALNTVNGCVRALKSGVGAFGLLAGLFLFLPVIAECLLWILTLILCSGISQVFDLKEITSLLKASTDVVSTMMAILLCCMMILVISTVVMMVIGGAA